MEEQFQGSGVHFVTFDFTSDATKKTAANLAGKLGIKEIYDKTAPKTGFVLIIDRATKKVVGKLSKKQSTGDWTKQLNSALKGA